MARPEKIEVEQALKYKSDLGTVTLTHKSFILYALGIGFSTDPDHSSDFKFTYKYDEDFTCTSPFSQPSPLLHRAWGSKSPW